MRSLLLAYAFALTLLFGIAYGISYTERGNRDQNTEQKGGNADPWGLWSDVGQLLFAGVLAGTAIVQILLWSRANKTAEKSFDETVKTNKANLELARKSIDVAVEAVRGRPIAIRADVTPDRKSITYTIRNDGKEPLIVRQAGWIPYYVHGVWPTVPRRGVNAGVIPDVTLAHRGEFTMPTNVISVPPDCQNHDGTLRTQVLIEIEVKYRTIGQRRAFHFAWMHFTNPDGGSTLMPYQLAGFELDEEVTRPLLPGQLNW